MGLMAEALTERQLTLRSVALVLAQVRNQLGQRVIERDVAVQYEVKDRGVVTDLGQ